MRSINYYYVELAMIMILLLQTIILHYYQNLIICIIIIYYIHIACYYSLFIYTINISICLLVCVCSVMSKSVDPLDYSPPDSSEHGIFPCKNTGVGCHALLQVIFPTQGSKIPTSHLLYLLHWQVGSLSLVGSTWEAPSICLGIFNIIGWRRQWHPTPVPLPGKSHGQRSLVGCSPWGR